MDSLFLSLAEVAAMIGKPRKARKRQEPEIRYN